MIYLAILLLVISFGLYLIGRGKSVRELKVPLLFSTRVLTPIAVILFIFSSLTVVPAGHVGVLDTFGSVSEYSLQSGIRLRNPFADVVKMSIQTQETKETMVTPSKEGLPVSLEVSLLYHLDGNEAYKVYKNVGTNYIETIVLPQFRSVVRSVTGSYEAKALYTAERETLAKKIQSELGISTKSRGVVSESILIRKVTLPEQLSKSIEFKLQAEQESQRMDFVLSKERKEAERKTIEAQGIASFQAIVTQGISAQLLEWKGIEATEKFASSPNSKIIIIGSGKDGLPVILNASEK